MSTPIQPRTLWEVLEQRVGTPALFLGASTTVGLLSGWTTGLVTAVSTNLMETPAARPHILRMTRWFGLAGVVHGIVGAGILAVTGSDSYKNRAIAGCTAGLAMGISKGSAQMACGLCLGMAALSLSERVMSTPLREGIKQVERSSNMLEPVFSTDAHWIESWRRHIQLTADGKK